MKIIKVLTIEDNSIIAKLLREILEKENYFVFENLSSAEEAIAFLKVHKPELVIIDIMLNGKDDGIKIGEYLLKKDTIPYIYVTSYNQKEIMDKIKRTRPHGFIAKPFKPIDIKTTVDISYSK